MSQLLKVFAGVAIVAAAFPLSADAQLRTIIGKNVAASSSSATLDLEFDDRESLEVRFEEGSVSVDGSTVGTYEPGGALDIAWRAMLGEAMSLENGALAEMLVAWSPADDLSDEAVEVARRLDDAIDQAIEAEGALDEAQGSVTVSAGDDGSLVRALLGSVSRLGVLEEALAGLDQDFIVHIDEDVEIPEGATVEGTLVVIEGDLRVEGRIEGDVVSVGGSVDVRETGVVEGEVRVADARVVGNRGEVRGGIVDVLEDDREYEDELRDRLREEIRREIRSDLRNEIRSVTRLEDDDSFSIMSPIRPVVRGVGGVIEKLILVFVLGLLGAGFLAFAGENMDAIAETARRAPGRAAMVGIAGSFLLVPVWILGAVALVVSIIGIPVAIAWLPIFPLAAALAGLLGYLAVARNAGEWLADSNVPWTGWIRKSNPIYTLFGGLLGLTLAFMAAHLLSIAPFLGVFSGLLFVIGGIVTFLAMQVGFGAVLLTRAGRRREYTTAYDPDAAWEAAMHVDVDDVEADFGQGAEANDTTKGGGADVDA